jgi:hypothetical protein
MTGPPTIDPGPFPPAGRAPVPVPPPGPGVQPPFVAPPTDGARRRRWVALGLAGAALLICCVGGAGGLGSLIVLASRVAVQSEQRAVSDYLTALSDGNYDDAYALLCPRVRAGLPFGEFQDVQSRRPKIISFEVGTPSTNSLVVPATVDYNEQQQRAVHFTLEQDRTTGKFWVCGTDL